MITLTDKEAANIVQLVREHGMLSAGPLEKFFQRKKNDAIAADFEPDTDKTIADSYHNG